MPTRVQLPDGSIGEFPDGMPESQIEAVLQKQYGGPQQQTVAGAGPLGLPQPKNPTVDMQPQSNGPQALVDAVSAVTPGQRAGHSLAYNMAQDFGSSAIGNTVGALAHPWETLKSVAKSTPLGQTYETIMDPGGLVNSNPLVSAYKDAKQNGLSVAVPRLAGALTGQAATGEGLRAAAPVLAPAVTAAGDDIAASGVNHMNEVGGSLKPDFKRGANPGLAYLDAGGGPALSMRSLANKSAALKGEVGEKLGAARQAATDAGKLIPVGKVLGALNPPIAKAVGLEMGPGGINNVDPIQRYADGFTPALEQAKRAGGFTPNSLFDLKQGIAQNTNWSDPSQFNLKAVRQQQAGALGGVLTDEVPELKPLNSQYQGLKKFAARTESRADTGSVPLSTLAGKGAVSGLLALTGGLTGLETGHAPLMTLGGGLAGLAIDSVPARTSLATGLYSAGRGLNRAGTALANPLLFPTAPAIAPYYLNQKANGKGDNSTK